MNMSWLEPYINQQVVVELGDSFTVFGTLITVSPDHLVFVDADLHCQSDANSNRDVYAIEAKGIGIRKNRDRLAVPIGRLIAIARLDEVSS